MLTTLNLPTFEPRLNNKQQIFDPIRKKWVALTPEEYIRQAFLAFLIEHRAYPKTLIKVEESITAFGKVKRCDAVIYNNEIEARAIVECKKPEVKLDSKVFEQIAIYNSTVKAPFLIVTNGMEHYCHKFNFKSNKAEFLNDIPNYNQIVNI